ncbi:MAG TPA: hypothetical protein VMV84_02260 [Dehalococcoidales bacterium]|nr:hypothetical protein [Dehalococcoidales bacterium]
MPREAWIKDWVASLVIRKVRGEGMVKLERAQVICPACGELVEAVAADGRVKGYCAVAEKRVDFLIVTQPVPIDETKAKISGLTPGRDSGGHFVKGNVPSNKKG